MHADKTVGEDQKLHWIYVLGGAALREKAHAWQERKSQQGKGYTVIEGMPDSPAEGRLAQVGNADVLYVFADGVSEGRLGPTGLTAAELAEHLRAEGLDAGHRSLKLFASRSGDETGSETTSFAEHVYRLMLPEHPRLVVHGYRGEVDAEGFDGHKTAGLGESDALAAMSREQWLAQGARARDNRVVFPAENEPTNEL